MRNFIFFILFLFPIVASAQFPANPRKMRLGYQTTADGLIYRASGAPNFTPADSDDARVYIDTETGDLYVYNSGWIKTARKTDAITRVDTVNQINHGFSVGDPLWKSGDYVLARDTGLSVTVSGIVIDSFDANTFYVQRNGVFTLTGHGFMVDQQLYVQPDGSYSAADNANSLLYGFAIDENTIQIGATTEGIRAISNYFDNSLAGRASTKQAMLDSLAGFQSFKNISAVTAASPSVGYTIEDRNTGVRYKVLSDTITGLAVDNNFQRALGSNYIIKTSPHVFEFSNENVTAAVTSGIASYNKNFVYDLSISNASDYTVTLPAVTAVDTNVIIKITASDSSDNDYIIQPSSGVINLGAGRYANKYRMDDGEEIELRNNGTYWTLISTNYTTPTNWPDRKHIFQYVNFGDYTSYPLPSPVWYDHDSVTVVKKINKAPWGENLLKRSAELLQSPWWNANSNIVLFDQDVAVAPNGKKQVDRAIPNAANPFFTYNPASQGASGTAYDLWEQNSTYTISVWASVQAGDTSFFYIKIPNTTVSAGSDTSNVTNTSLQRYSYTFTTDASIAVRQKIDIYISPNDSINFWNFQLERTSVASPDIVTGNDDYRKLIGGANPDHDIKSDQDTTYLVVNVNSSKLNTSSVNNIEDPGHTTLKKQLDYCAIRQDCNTVFIDEPITIVDTVIVPENIILEGRAKIETSIYVDVDDNWKSGLIIGDPGTNYNLGIQLKNLRVEALSDCYSVINGRGSLRQVWKNVVINGNDFARYGYYENSGVAGAGEFRSINLMIDDLEITQCDTAAWTTFQHTATINNAIVTSSSYGWIVAGGGFSSDFFHCENIENRVLWVKGGSSVKISHFAGEAMSTSNIYNPVYVQNARVFTLTEGTGGDAIQSGGTNLVMIELDTVKRAKIAYNRFVLAGTGSSPVSTTANTDVLWYENNYFEDKGASLNTSLINDATLFFYFNDDDRKSTIPRLSVVNATIQESVSYDSDHDEDINVLSDSIILSPNANIIPSSDSIYQFPYWNGSTGATIKAGATDPDGGTGAGFIIPLAGTQFQARNAGYWTIKEDTWYNLSFYAKLANSADTSYIVPLLADSDLSDASLSDTAYLTNVYQRFSYVFKTDETVADLTPNLTFRIASTDSLIFAFPQLSEGKRLKAYIGTGKAGATSAVTRGTVVFDGNMVSTHQKATIDSLYDSSGSIGASGDVAVSTAQGWEWRGISYGEAYIDYVDPDTVTVVTAGTLYNFTDISEGSSSSDITISTTTGRLTYTGTLEKLFEVTWTATVTSNANNENLIGTVMDNGSTITRIRWEEEDTAAGDTHSVSASGFFSMGQNDWVQPKLTSQTNGTQIEVITMSFRIKEVR